MRQSIVSWVGHEDDMENFDLVIRLPAPTQGATAATISQQQSVERFFRIDAGSLDDEQAHRLLCFRDYARAVIEHDFTFLHGAMAESAACWTAAFIAQDAKLADEVVRYLERRFREGRDDDTLATVIGRTKGYAAVADFTAMALLDMGAAVNANRRLKSSAEEEPSA